MRAKAEQSVPKRHKLRKYDKNKKDLFQLFTFSRTVLQAAQATTTSFAGWSSPVARQAHNLKVVSSNLAPATKLKPSKSHVDFEVFFCSAAFQQRYKSGLCHVDFTARVIEMRASALKDIWR